MLSENSDGKLPTWIANLQQGRALLLGLTLEGALLGAALVLGETPEARTAIFLISSLLLIVLLSYIELHYWRTRCARAEAENARLKQVPASAALPAPTPSALPPPDAMQISPLGHTLLCKMFDHWEEKEEWLPNELRTLLRPPLEPLIEIEMALDDLVSLGFAGKNEDDPDHLWLRGEPEPGSYYIDDPGKRYVRSLGGRR